MNNIINFINLIKKTILIFKIYDKKYLIFLILILSIFLSLFEILTIGSLLPLIDIILNSSKYLENNNFLAVTNFFGLKENNFKLFIILGFGILLFLSYSLRVITLWINSYVINDFKLKLDSYIFSNTLGKDYKYLINTSSSVLFGNMEKSELASGSVFGLINLMSSLILSLSVISFIFILNYKVALILGISFSIIYLLLIILIKNKLKTISLNLSEATNLKYKNIIECNDNIKEIKLRNLKEFFLNKISKPFLALRNARISSEVLNNIPSQIIILSTALVILFLIYNYAIQSDGLNDNLQIIIAIIFAAQRILPSMQNIYAAIIGIKMAEFPLNDILKISSEKTIINLNNTKKINFNKFIEIKNLSFKHNINSELIFNNLNVKFENNKIYSLIGESGVGKTTFFDLLMGLLSSATGNYYIDDQNFDPYKNKYWQSKICHIPQNSLLADTTILENITYGSDQKDINLDKINQICEMAELKKLINNSEKGLETIIGEKGLKISGGERQRLSFAKAIYANKDIYLFDEATNALDEKTEDKIFNNLKKIFENKIVILISHNDKIRNYCDHIYEIKNKKIEIIK